MIRCSHPTQWTIHRPHRCRKRTSWSPDHKTLVLSHQTHQFSCWNPALAGLPATGSRAGQINWEDGQFYAGCTTLKLQRSGVRLPRIELGIRAGTYNELGWICGSISNDQLTGDLGKASTVTGSSTAAVWVKFIVCANAAVTVVSGTASGYHGKRAGRMYGFRILFTARISGAGRMVYTMSQGDVGCRTGSGNENRMGSEDTGGGDSRRGLNG